MLFNGGTDMLVQGKLLSYGDDLSEVYDIRKKVFQEEQGVAEEIEFDEFDQVAVHVLVYEDSEQKKAVATGRIVYQEDCCKIGRVAVLKENRGMKYGDFVVRMLLNKAFLAGINSVYLNAQLSTIGFYEKIGFKVTGNEFEEAGIRHIKMIINKENLCYNCDRID